MQSTNRMTRFKWHANAIYDETSQQIIEEVPAPPIYYLVFEGGGFRGLAYGGVLNILEHARILPNIRHVAGSSIGAIIGLLAAIGYKNKELKEMLMSLDFTIFLEGEKSWPFTPELIVKGKQYLNILCGNSLSKGQKLLEWLEDAVAKKMGNKQATFHDLAARVLAQPEGHYLYKYLWVTGSNLTKNRLDIFNHETTPHMPLALALRISASFPGVFKAVEWDSGQGVCIYIDGGLMLNLPYYLFNDRQYLPEHYDFTEKGMNAAMLLVKVDTEEEIAEVLWNHGLTKSIKGITEYYKAVLDGMQSRDREIYEQLPTNIIQVFDNGISTLQFDGTAKDKQILFWAGEDDTMEWLQNHLSEAYSIKTFPDEKTWLADKTLDEIVAIKTVYESMLTELQDQNTKTQNLKYDLANKINWLQNVYLPYRINPNGAEIVYTPHIDISIARPRAEIDKFIKTHLTNKLLCVNKNLTWLDNKISNVRSKLSIEANPKNLETLAFYDYIIFLANLEEKHRVLMRAKTELEFKLNKAHQASNQCDQQYQASYFQFKNELAKFIAEKPLPTVLHYKLILLIYKHLTKRNVFFRTNSGKQFTLDLKDGLDLKIYFLSLMLYLKVTQNKNKIFQSVEKIYGELFGSEMLPQNLQDLALMFHLDSLDLALLTYRIESLTLDFLRLYKFENSYSPKNINEIFLDINSANKHAKKQMKEMGKEEGEAYELDFIEPPFSTERFSIFHKIEAVNHPISEDHELEEPSQSVLTKGPKCMRRFVL